MPLQQLLNVSSTWQSRIVRIGLACVVHAFGSIAIAHETWVLPSSFQVDRDVPIQFDLTSGMEFPKNETAIRPERVQSARVRLNGNWSEPLPLRKGELALVMESTPQENGLLTLSVELKPKDIELTDDLVREYFDEINASETIRQSWSVLQGKTPWREVYTKHAKTFVSIGAFDEDPSWKEPAGLKLELVPISNPMALMVGSPLEVKLLRNGVSLPNCSVGVFCEGNATRSFATTDANGVAEIHFSYRGRALIYVVDLRVNADGTWESDFSTLTLMIH